MKIYKVYHLIDRYVGIPVLLLLALFDRIFRGRTDKPQEYKKILIIKLAMVGDTILLAPSVRALRKKFPESHIAMLCSPINKAIVEEWGFIDERIIFDFARYFSRPWKLFQFLGNLRKTGFDVTLDFETWPRIMPIIEFFTGARIRTGFKVPNQMRHFLFTECVEHVKNRHELKCFADLMGSIGVKVDDVSIDIKPSAEVSGKIRILLTENGIGEEKPFVIVHPGCGIHGYYRKWQEGKFADVADYIIEKYGIPVAITGSRDDFPVTRKVISSMRNEPADLTAKTNLKEFFALVHRSLFVICGNTGTMHIAAATGKKTIAIHGPTDPEKWGPWGVGHIIVRKDLPCSPCSYLGYEFRCRDRKCTELISADEVIKAVDDMMKKIQN